MKKLINEILGLPETQMNIIEHISIIRKVSHFNSLINCDTFLFYKRRRYLCKSCQTSFVENNPFTANGRTKVSSKSIINILDDLKPYNETFSSAARRYNLSVSKCSYF